MSERVSVICGTNRSRSNSSIVSKKVADLIVEMGLEVEHLNLQDLPKDFVFNNEVISHGSPELSELVERFITTSSHFVFVLPEYNGSFPGVVKAFLDAFPPKRISGKKALLIGVSSGRAGNLRGMEHFTGVLNYLKVHVWPFKMAIDHIDQKIDSISLEFNDDHSIIFLKRTLADFLS